MITTGIIKNVADETGRHCKVRMPVFNGLNKSNPTYTEDKDLYDINLSFAFPGTLTLQDGVEVVVGIFDNDVSQPIFLGFLNQSNLNDKVESSLSINNMNVSGTLNAHNLSLRNRSLTKILTTLLNSGDSPFLPRVTSNDDGKFLRVVKGQWAPQEIPIAEGNSF